MKKTLALIILFTVCSWILPVGVDAARDVESQAEILDHITPTDTITPQEPTVVQRLTDFAAQFLGRKYMFGATGPKSFDCSGFTSYVFGSEGIKLPRTSCMQYLEGEAITRENLQAGDLMFFSSPRSGNGRVGHVGIVVSVNDENNSVTFIHASQSKGISYQTFPDGGYFSKRYIGAKRVIDTSAPYA